MSRILNRTQFGNPILRTVARKLEPNEIVSEKIQTLIEDMLFTLEIKKYGIGLAAPQIGESIALSVISVKPTPTRPELEKSKLIIINPEITQTYGRRTQKWEGCISFGSGRNFPYAKALRWSKIHVRYLDEKGIPQEGDFDGMLAHVLQHEIDHLQGVLFVDRVRDSKTYVMVDEYKKRILPLERKRKRR
jgi:peptide deformylase